MRPPIILGEVGGLLSDKNEEGVHHRYRPSVEKALLAGEKNGRSDHDHTIDGSRGDQEFYGVYIGSPTRPVKSPVNHHFKLPSKELSNEALKLRMARVPKNQSDDAMAQYEREIADQ